MTHPEHLRKPYLKAGLDRNDLLPDPLDLFRRWWEDVLETGLDEPNAMTLATSTPDGRPSARTVLMKGFSQAGIEFFTNYGSRKAGELDQNPHVAILFFWRPLERQVRIEGTVERISRERSELYFQSRPRGSQVGAWASPQSRVIRDRVVLEDEARRIEQAYADTDPLPLPGHWGGYLVRPHSWEFWQGREDRLHDRFLYRRGEGNEWVVERLAP